ncbi:MAG: hypothetical protein OXC99_04445 [Chloroflexi bacterium]|nr:hypothetical protein [Chloroflexota bacterium]
MSHGGFLRQHSDDPELASHIMHDYRQADLDAQTRGMLDFAVKLTREPWAMKKADVNALRALGLTDEEILSVVLITCNFNFMSRLANGLGVELGEGRQEQIASWLGPAASAQGWLMTAKEG